MIELESDLLVLSCILVINFQRYIREFRQRQKDLKDESGLFRAHIYFLNWRGRAMM